MGLNWVNFRIRRAVKCGQNYKVDVSIVQLCLTEHTFSIKLPDGLSMFMIYVWLLHILSPVIDLSVNNFIMKLITHFILIYGIFVQV